MRALITNLFVVATIIFLNACSSIQYQPTVESDAIVINDQTDTIRSPQAPPLKMFPAFVSKPVNHFKLDNGLTVLHYQSPKKITATTLSGLFLHNPEPYDVLNLKLNANWNQIKIDEKPFRISTVASHFGSDLKVLSDSIATGWYFEVLEKDQTKAFELLTAIVNQRLYNDIELEHQKLNYNLEQQLKSVSGLSQSAQLYKSLVFSKQTSVAKQAKNSSRKAALKKITSEQLKYYFQHNFKPNNMVLIILSATPVEQLKPQIESIFKQINPLSTPLQEIKETPSKTNTTRRISLIQPQQSIYAISRPHSTQVDIRISFTPMNLDNVEYQSIKLFAEVLAGRSLNSRMQSDLRERKGLSYSISNQLSQISDFHSLHFLSSTENHKLPALLKGMQQHIDFLLEHGLSLKEFEFIKQRRLISLQRTRLHPYRKMSFMLQNFTNQNPLDKISFEALELSQLSFEGFNQFLKKLKNQQRLTILTGDNNQIRHHLCLQRNCPIAWYNKRLEAQ